VLEILNSSCSDYRKYMPKTSPPTFPLDPSSTYQTWFQKYKEEKAMLEYSLRINTKTCGGR
jgi:hypothetical protein